MNKLYFDITQTLTRNALLYFVIGERGVGKSYSTKKYVVNHFKKKGKQFVYIRRYKTEIKNAMGKQGENKFFEQIKGEFKNDKLTNTKDTMSINDKICGYAIPLSTANILKSSTFDKVDTIIFDEFLLDNGTYHYLQNEVIQFLDIIETIARLRDIKVIFLGNAISITNPYFTFFNLSLPYNSQYKTFKDGLIVVNYIKNEVYREKKKQTKFGKLIEGTEYAKYAIDNEFLRDNKTFILKKNKNCKMYFIFTVNEFKFGVWLDSVNGNMYISQDYDPNCPMKFALSTNSHTKDTLYINVKNNPYFKSLILHYRTARLCFENQQIKNICLDCLTKYITI